MKMFGFLLTADFPGSLWTINSSLLRGESLPCLLVIASFRKISSASNRVLCDQPIHHFCKADADDLAQEHLLRKAQMRKAFSFHFSQVPAPFALVLMHFISLTWAV